MSLKYLLNLDLSLSLIKFSFDSDWKSYGALPIISEQYIIPNKVYSIPPSFSTSVSVDQRILDKA